MAEIDTAQEWQRLQDLYGSMSEEELEVVANEGYELTDIAKQALNSEISRRHLQVVVRLAPPLEEPEIPEDTADKEFNPTDLDLAQAWSVENKDEAEWVKTTLNQAGIPCYFAPGLVEEVSELDFARDPAFSVRVLESDLERARHALKDFNTHFGKQEEELPEFVAHCPRCHSTEVVFQGLDSSQREKSEDSSDSDGAEVAEQPEQDAPGSKFNWSCEACGHHWKDDGVES